MQQQERENKDEHRQDQRGAKKLTKDITRTQHFGAFTQIAQDHGHVFNNTARHLSTGLHALTMPQHQDASFAKALLQEAKHKLGEFNVQDLSNTAWAMAKFEHHKYDMMMASHAKQLSTRHQFNKIDITDSLRSRFRCKRCT
jgi:hypothetical protein